MMKVMEKARIQGAYLNIIKAIYRKPIDNIKLNGKKFKAFPLKQGQNKAVYFPHISSICYVKF